MIYTLDPAAMKWDLKKLPPELSLAFNGSPSIGHIMRLTETDFALRLASGAGPWLIGPLEELLPHFQQMRISEPIKRQTGSVADPLDLSFFDIKL